MEIELPLWSELKREELAGSKKIIDFHTRQRFSYHFTSIQFHLKKQCVRTWCKVFDHGVASAFFNIISSF